MLTIQDYILQDDKKSFFRVFLQQAKEKNTKNSSVLRREDDYIQRSQEAQFSKTLA